MSYIIFKVEECLTHSSDERITLVYDLRGLSYRSMDMALMKFTIEVFGKQYPEIMDKMIIIDAP